MTDIFNKAQTPWINMPKELRDAIDAQADAGATVERCHVHRLSHPEATPQFAYRIRPGTEKDITPEEIDACASRTERWAAAIVAMLFRAIRAWDIDYEDRAGAMVIAMLFGAITAFGIAVALVFWGIV